MYQFFAIESKASLKTYFRKSYEQQFLSTIFPLISARPQISARPHKRRPLISEAPLGIHIERSAPPVINAAPPNMTFIGVVIIVY